MTVDPIYRVQPAEYLIASQPDFSIKFSKFLSPDEVLKAWLKVTSNGFKPYFLKAKLIM